MTPNCQQLFRDPKTPNYHQSFSNKRMPNCRQSFSNYGDVMLMSSNQTRGDMLSTVLHLLKDLILSKTMAVTAMMRGELKDGYQR
jgi:hypothetical protein